MPSWQESVIPMCRIEYLKFSEEWASNNKAMLDMLQDEPTFHPWKQQISAAFNPEIE